MFVFNSISLEGFSLVVANGLVVNSIVLQVSYSWNILRAKYFADQQISL